MGVRGLWNFVEQNPRCYVKIDVEEAIRKEKVKNGESPLIIIDVAGIATLKGFPAETLCGSRSQMNLKRISAFCDRLKKAGARLAFVSDCSITHKSRFTWMTKHNSRYKDHTIMLNELDNTPLGVVAAARPNVHIPVISYSSLRGTLEKYGDYETSAGESRDILIAQYAERHKAYAVVADGADMLIFASIKRIWRCNNINYVDVLNENEPLMVKEARSDELQKALNLKAGGQMAMWATLIGNEFVTTKYTKNFFAGEDRYMRLSEYVKNMETTEWDKLANSLGRALALKAGDVEKKDEVISAIRKSLRFYRMEHYERVNPLEEKYKRYLNEREYLHYAILVNRPLEIVSVMEDQSDESMEAFATIAVEAYQRVMGVVLNRQKDEEDITRKIWARVPADPNHREKSMRPVYPDFPIPDIETIVFDKAKMVLEDRLKILNFIFSMSWSDTALTKDVNYSSMALALDILEQKMRIKKDKTDLIRLTCKELVTGAIPDDIELPERVQKRGVQIAFKFLSVFNLVNIVLQTIGLGEYAKVLPFDAVRFQNKFNENTGF